MKGLLAIVLVSLVAGLGCSQQIPEASAAEIQAWFADERSTEQAVECFIQFTPNCDPRARGLSSLLLELIRNNLQCSSCSNQTKQNIKFVVNTLQTKYPRQWRKLIEAI
ncbi:unnamed protein product, partial [Meganyctiphanes norvegica]